MEVETNFHSGALAKRRLDLWDDELNDKSQAGVKNKKLYKQATNVDGSVEKADTLGTEKEMNVSVQRRTEQTPLQ
jgi:hypothetical protein